MKDNNKNDENIFIEQKNIDFRGVDFADTKGDSELGPHRVQYSPTLWYIWIPPWSLYKYTSSAPENDLEIWFI